MQTKDETPASTLDALGRKIHDLLLAEHPDLTKEQLRDRTAVALGYFPAWRAAELYQTYGLHPIDQMVESHKRGLKMDWSGLRSELLANGTKPETAEAIIAEARNMESFLAGEAR